MHSQVTANEVTEIAACRFVICVISDSRKHCC